MAYLPLTDGHTMYYEEHGNRNGQKAVILHGGPGGGLNIKQLSAFDLKHWHVIMFDQRGCGKSTPFGIDSLGANTTQHLVNDIECLRNHLGIDKWFVFGQSWGTTLGLVYAETHPTSVTGLLLRSVCLLQASEDRWLYGGGAGLIYPKEWATFISIVPKPHTAKNVLNTYRRLLTHKDQRVRRRAALKWCNWEFDISFLVPRKVHETIQETEACAILENHYFYHNAWLKPNQIIDNAGALKNIPVTLVHGRYDMVCTISASYHLKEAIPHLELIVIQKAGHASEPATRKAFIRTTRAFRRTRKA